MPRQVGHSGQGIKGAIQRGKIEFHNYKTSKDRTAVKDSNLLPIRQMVIPTSVTAVNALLGCTGQMVNYSQDYAICAAPLHELTRKSIVFPKPWLKGSDYDIAFHRPKSMLLDKPLHLWNKDSSKRLFIEVGSSQHGWGVCAYRYDSKVPSDVCDEGRYRLLDKSPTCIICWISKAHTQHE